MKHISILLAFLMMGNQAAAETYTLMGGGGEVGLSYFVCGLALLLLLTLPGIKRKYGLGNLKRGTYFWVWFVSGVFSLGASRLFMHVVLGRDPAAAITMLSYYEQLSYYAVDVSIKAIATYLTYLHYSHLNYHRVIPYFAAWCAISSLAYAGAVVSDNPLKDPAQFFLPVLFLNIISALIYGLALEAKQRKK